MKKIIIVIMLAMIMLTGCKDNNNLDDKGSNNKNEEKGKLNFADNLYFKINGTKIEVNTECYDILKKNGWHPNPKKYEESKLIIKGKNTNKYNQTLSDIQFINDKYSKSAPLIITFKNEGDEDIDISKGKCVSLSFNAAFVSTDIELIENIPNIEMPGGLKIGSTQEEAEKIFGKPNQQYNATGEVYSYGKSHTEGYYKFEFYENLGLAYFEIYKNISK